MFTLTLWREWRQRRAFRFMVGVWAIRFSRFRTASLRWQSRILTSTVQWPHVPPGRMQGCNSPLQCCRVPKNGLPKNGQAGILSKNMNNPRLEKWVKNGFTTRKERLLWRRLLQRHCWLRNDSTSTGRNISAASPARHALGARATSISSTVYALQAKLCDSKTDRKIRTRLAGVVKIRTIQAWISFGTWQYCKTGPPLRLCSSSLAVDP